MTDHTTRHSSEVKTCTKCGESKPLTEFSVNRNSKDNLHPYCKDCARAYGKEWRENNRAHRQEYMRKWHQANVAHETAYKRERYQNDEEHRLRRRQLDRAYRQRNLESVRAREAERSRKRDWTTAQVRARTIVNRAVRNGELPPAWKMVCEHCQEAQAQEYHHHKGYSQEHRLDVIALCLECHGKEHWWTNG